MARQERFIAITLLAFSVIFLLLGYGVEGKVRPLVFTWKPTQSPTARPTTASSSIRPTTVHPSYAPTRTPTRAPTYAPSPYPTASPFSGSDGNGAETDIGMMFLEITLPVLVGTALIILFFFYVYPYFFSSSPSQGVQPTSGPAPIMRDMELCPASAVSSAGPPNPLTPCAPVGQVVQILPLQGIVKEVVPSAPLAEDVIIGVPVTSPLAHDNNVV
eukprot:scaffold7918_cov196-Ochromonas_danica.AAC.1